MIAYRFEHRADRIAMVVRFDAVGDMLEMHEHTPPNYHDVAVDVGAITLRGPNHSWELTIKEGESVSLSDGKQHHEIVALVNNTVIANVYHQPRPNLEPLIGDSWRTD